MRSAESSGEGRAIPHWIGKTVTPKVKIISRKDAKLAKKTSPTADLGMTEMEMTADSASRDKPTPSRQPASVNAATLCKGSRRIGRSPFKSKPPPVDVLQVDSARPRALSPQDSVRRCRRGVSTRMRAYQNLTHLHRILSGKKSSEVRLNWTTTFPTSRTPSCRGLKRPTQPPATRSLHTGRSPSGRSGRPAESHNSRGRGSAELP